MTFASLGLGTRVPGSILDDRIILLLKSNLPMVCILFCHSLTKILEPFPIAFDDCFESYGNHTSRTLIWKFWSSSEFCRGILMRYRVVMRRYIIRGRRFDDDFIVYDWSSILVLLFHFL